MSDSGQQLGRADDLQANPADFAAMLTKIRLPERDARSWLAADNDFAANEEIIPLSYEQALKKHARRHSATPTTDRIDRVASLLAENLAERREQTLAESMNSLTGMPADYSSATEIDWNIQDLQQEAQPLQTAASAPLGVPETKAVSVTLRMNRQEASQVRQRAADAGLTVSAYIRSCVCEAEVLRAQVKSALQEMRQASEQKMIRTLPHTNRPWWNRLAARG